MREFFFAKNIQAPDSLWGDYFSLRGQSRKAEAHRLDFGVLTCVESGALIVNSEAEETIVTPGQLSYLPPRQEYQTKQMTKQLSGWFLCIPRLLAKPLPRGIHIFQTSDLLPALSKRIISWGLLKSRPAAHRRLGLCLVDELLAIKGRPTAQLPVPAHPVLYQITSKLLTLPEDQHGIDYWAKKSGMSRRTFTRTFARETGISFVGWRQRMKLSFALQWLTEGQRVSAVAASLGYQSASAFIAAFRRQYGSAPREFLQKKQRQILPLLLFFVHFAGVFDDLL